MLVVVVPIIKAVGMGEIPIRIDIFAKFRCHRGADLALDPGIDERLLVLVGLVTYHSSYTNQT